MNQSLPSTSGKAFGYSKGMRDTGPTARGIGELDAQQDYRQVNPLAQSWVSKQPQYPAQGATMAQATLKNTAGKKPKGSLYADVSRL